MAEIGPAVLDYRVRVCEVTGFDTIEVEHDGTITWLDMQLIKNKEWGEDAIGFEMFPPASEVVNGESVLFHYRHIWRWPSGVTWPNFGAGR